MNSPSISYVYTELYKLRIYILELNFWHADLVAIPELLFGLTSLMQNGVPTDENYFLAVFNLDQQFLSASQNNFHTHFTPYINFMTN